MYLLLLRCLFERFVNMYLLSMFVNYHTCCGLVLLFGTNCLCECRNNGQMFAIRHVWYNAFVNLQCIIECRPEIRKSLLVWPTVLFEATIFVRMMHWSCDTFILEKIKGTFFVKSGFIFMFRLSFRLIFSFLQSLFFFCSEITCIWVLNLCLIYRFLQQLTRSRTVYCITRCEKIIEHTGTPVNIDEKDNWILQIIKAG